VEDRSATAAQDVADGLGQLDIGIFERLLDPLRVARDLPNQLLARPREIPEFLNRRRRNEAAPNQSHRQEVGQPAGILDVTFATRDVAHMEGVSQRELELALEQMPDGFPVDPPLIPSPHACMSEPPASQRVRGVPAW